MGLLTLGEPLEWSEIEKHSASFRQRGIDQFINLYTTFKNRDHDSFKYGDEIEYSLVKFDHEAKRVYLLLKSNELLQVLNKKETEAGGKWMPEYPGYMIEGIPAQPYTHNISDMLNIEKNMSQRRKQVTDLLGPDEYIMTFSTFPLLGCLGFTWPIVVENPQEASDLTSAMFPDKIVFQEHPRQQSIMKHIRERRGSKTSAHIPLFFDTRTPQPFAEWSSSAPRSGQISLENICGSCACLQVTFQATNLAEARLLYDQLVPLTPVILALSAASPIWRGYLCDIDCRWKVMSEALDDRMPDECGIPKSRYDSVDCYLSPASAERFNDMAVVKHEEFYARLVEHGVDEPMAQHVSHLFVRDPLVMLRESLVDTGESTENFESIQSTNWQSLRFKPPPSCDPSSAIGWRVEFRTPELQVTDFENAAFVVFLALLTRAILSFKLDLLVPISKVDENMRRAQRRDACIHEKLFFRSDSADDRVDEMSLDEIVNGGGSFLGLIPLVKNYLANFDVDFETQSQIDGYLNLIEAKANGTVKTTAAYMREFVMGHPSYKADSRVTNEIAYDLMWHLNSISMNS